MTSKKREPVWTADVFPQATYLALNGVAMLSVYAVRSTAQSSKALHLAARAAVRALNAAEKKGKK